jgi:ribosome assembly protein YihI (activator of Der GTPase)
MRPRETADEKKENERRGTAEKGHGAQHGHKKTTAAAQATTSRAYSAHKLPLLLRTTVTGAHRYAPCQT